MVPSDSHVCVQSLVVPACRGERGVSFSKSTNSAAAYEPLAAYDSDMFEGSPAAGVCGSLLALLQVHALRSEYPNCLNPACPAAGACP